MSSTPSPRKPYPTDISDEEWAFVAPYLVLLPDDASQRRYLLREVFDGVRYIVKTGAHWRMLPHDLLPWPVVYQQMRRWMTAGCFETLVADLRILLRRAAERHHPPTAAILDSRTLQSTPESGACAGYDGAERRKGSKGRRASAGWRATTSGWPPRWWGCTPSRFLAFTCLILHPFTLLTLSP